MLKAKYFYSKTKKEPQGILEALTVLLWYQLWQTGLVHSELRPHWAPMFSKLLTAKQQHKYLILFPSLETSHNIKQQSPTSLNLFAAIIYYSIKKYSAIQSLKHNCR